LPKVGKLESGKAAYRGAIVERPFNDGRIDAEIGMLQEKMRLLGQLRDLAQREVDIRNNALI
jgi:hypothetical protein